MATEYQVSMELELEPVQHPWVRITVPQHSCQLQLTQSQKFQWQFTVSEQFKIQIEMFDKHEMDPHTAVKIKSINFFGISDPKFVWAGIYSPVYPDHYHPKVPKLVAQDYLGWNGIYELEIDVPVFTWIHKIQNLGWIHQI